MGLIKQTSMLQVDCNYKCGVSANRYDKCHIKDSEFEASEYN